MSHRLCLIYIRISCVSFLLLTLLSIYSTPLSAQVLPENRSSSSAPASSLESAPPSEPASAALLGHWTPRRHLEEQGVKPFAILTAELWRNTSGGLQVGSWWNTLLDFGVEFDTGKLGLWPGGSLMAQGHWVENQDSPFNFAGKTGALNPVSSAMANDHIRVYNLYYQQTWQENAYTLKIGQQAADEDFMLSDYSSLFLNSAFGPLPSQVGTPLSALQDYHPAFPVFPVAGPGILFAARPSPKWFAQAGLYHGHPGGDHEDNYGFDWTDDFDTGIGLFYEGGYSYSIGSHPGTFKVGGTYHNGHFDDYQSIIAGDPEATSHGNYSFYAINDLVLVSNHSGTPILGLFGRFGFSPKSEHAMIATYADTGLNWFAPLPCRPHDVAGIAFSVSQYGDEFRNLTGADIVSDVESALELTYQARITPWFLLQADLQFLFNPALNPDSRSRETATVLGLRAQVTF